RQGDGPGGSDQVAGRGPGPVFQREQQRSTLRCRQRAASNGCARRRSILVALPWTKFQDFYLRLGMLKVLVASLSPERRSSTNDVLSRSLSTPLLEPAKKYPSLWSDVQHRVPWYQRDHAQGKFDKPSVTEALLVVQDCPSWLFAVTAPP